VTLQIVAAPDWAEAAWTGWRIPAAQVRAVSDAAQAAADLRALQARLREGQASAYRAARAEGMTAARAAARAEAQAQDAARWTALEAQVRELEAEASAQIADLALSIVRRLAGGELGEAFIVRAAAEAARNLVAEVPLRVRAHPSAAAGIRGELRDILPGVAVVLDADAARDSCVFEMRDGEVDTSLHVQLAALETALKPSAAGVVS
jgi:flagellar biosynthesis/type III secretory pathway protein FliH